MIPLAARRSLLALLIAAPLAAQTRIASDFEIQQMERQVARSTDFLSQLSGHLNLGDLRASRNESALARGEYVKALEIAERERLDARRASAMTRYATATSYAALADAKLEDIVFADGKLVSKAETSRAVSIADVMRHGAADRIEKEKTNNFPDDGSHARNTHSAVFVEVKVDEQLGVIRVTRVVSAIACGRVLNTKTAHSQIMGSVVGGIGMALHEETLFDHRFGRIMNPNIAEYHVPVNADVHDIKMIFVDEPDQIVNPLGIKGLVAAAIANAVYHATGKRVRDLPITLDKLQR